MGYSDKDILFLSLAGTKVAESIPRFTAFQNEVMKHPLPAIPFLPFNQLKIWKSDNSSVDTHFFPLKFRRVIENAINKEPWYTFPYEPFISIKGKNKIVKRSVAKAQNFIGTIKEHWSQDDYDITITGMFFGQNEIGSVEECFPKADFEKLRDYCTWPLGIQVQCEPLQLLGINYLVVDDFDFPFTKGENVQAYELKCTSDFSADFLLEIE